MICMLKIKNLLLIGLLCCLSFSLYGQKATVRATIEPSDILIGEQAVINVEVIAPKDMNVIFPVYNDTLITGIEVLGMVEPDTVMTEVMTINQKYVITSFDSTLYHIPFIPVLTDNDTVYTNDLGLKVSAPQLLDSTLAYLDIIKNYQLDTIEYSRLQVHDIKDIQEAKWTTWDAIADLLSRYGIYVVIAFVVVILIAVAMYFLLRKKKKGYYFKPEVILPAHVVALKELDQLKDSKIWQKGQTKEYYTRLTDILRGYIDRRYGIDAPEMTSDEILEAIHRITDTASSTESLRQILKLADLVKFAKYVPPANEDDLSMINAYLFVNQTKKEEVVPPPIPGANGQPTQSSEVQPPPPPVTTAESDKGENSDSENKEANS